MCLRNFPQLFGRVQDQVEQDERKISIAQQEIGGLDCLEGFLAPHPKQIRQDERTAGVGIKGIAAIDEREKKTVSMRGLQKSMDEKGTARAGVRSSQLGDGVFRQSAADPIINRRYAGCERLSHRGNKLRKPFREQLPQIDQLAARAHASDWHKRAICSREQYGVNSVSAAPPGVACAPGKPSPPESATPARE